MADSQIVLTISSPNDGPPLTLRQKQDQVLRYVLEDLYPDEETRPNLAEEVRGIEISEEDVDRLHKKLEIENWDSRNFRIHWSEFPDTYSEKGAGSISWHQTSAVHLYFAGFGARWVYGLELDHDLKTEDELGILYMPGPGIWLESAKTMRAPKGRWALRGSEEDGFGKNFLLLEVGFTQTISELEERDKDYFESLYDLLATLVIYVEESPTWTSLPVEQLQGAEGNKREFLGPRHGPLAMPSEPNYNLVNKITEAWVEVWKRDGSNKKGYVRCGNRKNFTDNHISADNEELGVKLGDLFPAEVLPDGKENIHVDINRSDLEERFAGFLRTQAGERLDCLLGRYSSP